MVNTTSDINSPSYKVSCEAEREFLGGKLPTQNTRPHHELCASKFVVVTGRVDRWLKHPEQGTLNVSCTVKVTQFQKLYEDMHYVSTALRGAAGVNLVVNAFNKSYPRDTNWSWYIDSDHTDVATDKLINITSTTLNIPQYSRTSSLKRAVFKLAKIIHVDSYVLIDVADSMTENDGSRVSIEESWRLFYEALLREKKVVVDLSALRPSGTENKLGLTASGPLSFLKIYEAIALYVECGNLTSYLKIFSTLNEVLRRGGSYKNGATTATLDYNHSDVQEYLNLPLADVPYLKKGLRVYPELLDDLVMCDRVVAAVNNGSLWLEKDLGTHKGKQIHINVCRGVGLLDRGSCLLSHINAGMIEKPEDWVQAWRDTMHFTCSVFEVGAPRLAGIYRDPAEDRQVAVGVCGLANFLAYHKISYKTWVEAFERFLICRPKPGARTHADEMVWCLACGVCDAADIARSHNLRAAFTIEPCASCAYRYKDLRGLTLAPNIDPIVAIRGQGVVRRNSEAVATAFYDHGDVEVAADVGSDLHMRHRIAWQRLFDSTGLAHASSTDIWGDWTIDDLRKWFDSPLKTTYYSRQIGTTPLAKGRKIATAFNTNTEVCEACGD